MQNDEGYRLNELVNELEEVQQYSVIPFFIYEDAQEIFYLRADLGAVIVDWNLPQKYEMKFMTAPKLIDSLRIRNNHILMLLLTDRLETVDIPVVVLQKINGYLWKTGDTIEFMAGRIEPHVLERIQGVYPALFPFSLFGLSRKQLMIRY